MDKDKLYMFGDYDHPDMTKDDFWFKGTQWPEPEGTEPVPTPAPKVDEFDYQVTLRERIAILLIQNAPHLPEDDAFDLGKRLETWVRTGDTGNG